MEKVIYYCDRCKKECSAKNTKHSAVRYSDKTGGAYLDLCNRCFKSFKEWLSNG